MTQGPELIPIENPAATPLAPFETSTPVVGDLNQTPQPIGSAVPQGLATTTSIPSITPAAPLFTPTAAPSATPIPTATQPIFATAPIPTPVWTAGPSSGGPPSTVEAPTATSSPAPTQIVPTLGPPITPDEQGNRLDNPSFEGNVRAVEFPEINVFERWEPYYCDEPYLPRKCRALEIDEGNNPEGLMMGRPEFKPTYDSSRINGGESAQQWFCFYRPCMAGVYQTFDTSPGQLCEVGAFVQSWSAIEWPGAPISTFDNDDAKRASQWRIVLRLDGEEMAFGSDPDLMRGPFYGFDSGHYDQYIQIRMQFTATSSQTTVFFENLRLWPFRHNDSFIDDAYAYCQ
ncbi:MAG: hypothetical protein GYB68_05190 [Chloroflexi bacterium]|nr:hypothetical protein [Chloroflexota bacterium]